MRSRPSIRVLHVIDKSFWGGGQAAVRNLLEGFRGTEIRMLLACRDGGPLVESARSMEVPVHTMQLDKRFRPAPARQLARLMTSSPVDLVHAHGLVAATYCTLARSLYGTRAPLLYHQHGFHHHNYNWLARPVRRWAERAVSRQADLVVAVSRADAESLAQGSYASPERIAMVRYGIPEPSANGNVLESSHGLIPPAGSGLTVGLIGRLHHQKGIDTFLIAAAMVRKQAPSTRFLIVGTGELEHKLRRLATDLGLDPALTWAGERAAAPFVPLIDVAVVSSRWEGLPMVLLEYMAGARPIVTTDVAGCLEAIGPEEAVIVPRYDPAAMARGILELLADRSLAARLGAAARARYLREFTLSGMVRRFHALYVRLLSS